MYIVVVGLVVVVVAAAAAADDDDDDDDDVDDAGCCARSGVVSFTSSLSIWSHVTSCGCSARVSTSTRSSYEHSRPATSY